MLLSFSALPCPGGTNYRDQPSTIKFKSRKRGKTYSNKLGVPKLESSLDALVPSPSLMVCLQLYKGAL